MNPSIHKMTVLSQIFKLIPRNLIPKLAREYGVDKQSRSFSPTSHVLALMFGQLSHALGLNDICDTLRNHSDVLETIREAVPPSRNAFPHANRNRNPVLAEKLFWSVLEHLEELSPEFRLQGRQYCALPRRFKKAINVIDSTTIKLVANCLDWAKHRRKKIDQDTMILNIKVSGSTELFLPSGYKPDILNSNGKTLIFKVQRKTTVQRRLK